MKTSIPDLTGPGSATGNIGIESALKSAAGIRPRPSSVLRLVPWMLAAMPAGARADSPGETDPVRLGAIAALQATPDAAPAPEAGVFSIVDRDADPASGFSAVAGKTRKGDLWIAFATAEKPATTDGGTVPEEGHILLAKRFTERVAAKHPGAPIHFGGRAGGGALAQLEAARTGRDGETFDAPGMAAYANDRTGDYPFAGSAAMTDYRRENDRRSLASGAPVGRAVVCIAPATGNGADNAGATDAFVAGVAAGRIVPTPDTLLTSAAPADPAKRDLIAGMRAMADREKAGRDARSATAARDNAALDARYASIRVNNDTGTGTLQILGALANAAAARTARTTPDLSGLNANRTGDWDIAAQRANAAAAQSGGAGTPGIRWEVVTSRRRFVVNDGEVFTIRPDETFISSTRVK